MDKYNIFRKLLDFISDYAKVVDADMNYYAGCMRIVGSQSRETITLEISIKKEDIIDA